MKVSLAKKMLKGGGFANTAYDATATFGRVVAFFQMLGGLFFGFVFLAIGIWLIRSKAIYTQKLMAKVSEPKCNTFTTQDSNGRSSTQTQCNVTLVYQVNGTDYKTPFTMSGTYAENQMVEMQYNPENPSDIRQPAPQNKTIGIVLILIGLAIMIGTTIWFILTLKYKIVAAGTGAYTAVDWTTNAIVN
jgi:ATP-dependent Zn protease